MTFNVRQPWMEDNLWWKTTFDGRHLWWKTFYQHDYLKHLKLDNDNKKFKVNEIKKLSKGLAFPVILDLDLKPFSKLTFAHQVLPYLEQTFTWNSSVALLSLTWLFQVNAYCAYIVEGVWNQGKPAYGILACFSAVKHPLKDI